MEANSIDGLVRTLLAEARAAGLPFGVTGGRLWVHLSGEQLHLLHLATRLLVREAAVLAALGVATAAGDAASAPGGDHDQPYTPGGQLPFVATELRKLRRLRTRYARPWPMKDGPDRD